MTGRVRLGSAAALSGLVHLGVSLGLTGQSGPSIPPAVPLATIELSPLPPEPEPEAPPPEAPPQEAQASEAPPPEAPPRKVSVPDKPAPAAAVTEPAPAALALHGLVMSNAGLALGATIGASAQTRGRQNVTPAPPGDAAPPARRPARPALTPLSDLSRKPMPPALSAALERHYPPALRAQGVEGDALVQVTLGADGRVRALDRLKESHAGFGRACTLALREQSWSPPLDREGKRTGTRLKYRCRFKIAL